MRWKSQSRARLGDMQASMTPMIDVVFLLMIFFVCTASFQVVERSLPTPLAAGAEAASVQPADAELAELEEVVIWIRGDSAAVHYQVGEALLADRQSLRPVLANLVEAEAALPVILNVEPLVELGHVIEVYDLCRTLGFTQVQFAAPRQAG